MCRVALDSVEPATSSFGETRIEFTKIFKSVKPCNVRFLGVMFELYGRENEHYEALKTNDKSSLKRILF